MTYKEWYKEYVLKERTKSRNKNNKNSVEWDIINTRKYKDKFNNLTNYIEVNRLVYEKSIDILKHRENTNYEDLYVIDIDSGKVVGTQRNSSEAYEVSPNKSIEVARRKYKNHFIIHNHPTSLPPSGSDLQINISKNDKFGVVICHNGDVYKYRTIKASFSGKLFDLSVAKYTKEPYNMSEKNAYERALNDFKNKGELEW